MRNSLLLILSGLFLWGCSDSPKILYMDEAYVKAAQSRPTKFAEFKCRRENVVGRWYSISEAAPDAVTSACFWNFNDDGTVKSEGKCDREIPEKFKVKRSYRELINAYLDIEFTYNGGKVRIEADCTTDGKKMDIGEGVKNTGWTFYKAP
jgi:hypothetical protein